jgi:DNA-binding XRE family transcriptional regulator
MIYVTQLQHLGEYRMQLQFSDGTEGSVDLRALVDEDPLRSLRNLEMFAQAFVDEGGGTVAWPSGLDIAPDTLYALAHGFRRPESYEETQANELAVSLRELRKLSGTRQEALAETLAVTQGAVSRLENGAADAKIASLRRYLTALGWQLEVVAVKGDKRLRLRGV